MLDPLAAAGREEGELGLRGDCVEEVAGDTLLDSSSVIKSSLSSGGT